MEITFQSTENKKLTEITTLGPQFSIEFRINVSSYPSSEMANIFHFTSTGAECCQVGDRVPAIFLDNKGRLRVAFPLNGDGEELLNTRRILLKRRWYKVKIIQDKVYCIKFSNDLISIFLQLLTFIVVEFFFNNAGW